VAGLRAKATQADWMNLESSISLEVAAAGRVDEL
jgi:hypothetical protein